MCTEIDLDYRRWFFVVIVPHFFFSLCNNIDMMLVRHCRLSASLSQAITFPALVFLLCGCMCVCGVCVYFITYDDTYILDSIFILFACTGIYHAFGPDNKTVFAVFSPIFVVGVVVVNIQRFPALSPAPNKQI